MKQHGIFQQSILSKIPSRNMFGAIYEKKCIAENCSYGQRVPIITMLLLQCATSRAISEPNCSDLFPIPKPYVSCRGHTSTT
jgi:triacylglycerol esterase/lipase EstA (alpha/beta hydrolase family)